MDSVNLTTEQIQWVNALSTRASLEAAVNEVISRTKTQLAAQADLGIIFISSAFASEYSRLMPLVQEQLALPYLIGCSGSGIIGMNVAGKVQEVEAEPALSLTLMRMPNAKIQTFHLSADDLPDLDSPPQRWIEAIGISPESRPLFILFSDPASSKITELLEGLDFAYPDSIKLGGLASSSIIGNRAGLFHNYKQCFEGSVGVAITGNFTWETIVAQGCRPIGPVYRVTRGERNIIFGLVRDREPVSSGSTSSLKDSPLQTLRDLVEELSEDDKELAQTSLFVGIARNEFKEYLSQGDFLIRNLLGIEPKTGAMAIGNRVRIGQRIQFHLRDARASAQDLELLLEECAASLESSDRIPDPAIGAFMFSCLGRGKQLYGEPDFDGRLFQRYFPNIAVSGFFCNGEIGPVGGSTFLHGYTSVFGICLDAPLT
jgi:small ligand-binding sensory domain FIST